MSACLTTIVGIFATAFVYHSCVVHTSRFLHVFLPIHITISEKSKQREGARCKAPTVVRNFPNFHLSLLKSFPLLQHRFAHVRLFRVDNCLVGSHGSRSIRSYCARRITYARCDEQLTAIDLLSRNKLTNSKNTNGLTLNRPVIVCTLSLDTLNHPFVASSIHSHFRWYFE